jgi:hypothetical protein
MKARVQRDQFFFGGWVAPEEDWSRFFAPAWQERVLDLFPPIPYLHMTDIRRSEWRSEFGLSRLQADDRIDEACRLIDTMATLYPTGVHVNAGMLRDKFKNVRVSVPKRKPVPMEPDYLCFLAYAMHIIEYIHEKYPEAEKVDFVVERKMNITRYVQEFHSGLAACFDWMGEPSLSSLVGDLLQGGKECVPLQAADLLCWHSARPLETMDDMDRRRYAQLARREGFRMEIEQDELIKMHTAMSV